MSKSVCGLSIADKKALEKVYDTFDTSIASLCLSKPALRALASVEAWSMEKVRILGKSRISELHGIGKTALQRLFP